MHKIRPYRANACMIGPSFLFSMFSKKFIACENTFKWSGVEVQQVGSVNQFYEALWEDSVSEYSTSSQICGYLAIASARILRQLLKGCPSRALSQKELLVIHQSLQQKTKLMLLEVRRAMKGIREKRMAYIESNPHEFPNTREESFYIKALVASYEISDELRESVDTLSPLKSQWDGSSFPSVNFARENEYPQRIVATCEEKKRIELEQHQFGGSLDMYGVSHFDLEKGEVGFILERFEEESKSPLQLMKPCEWIQVEQLQEQMKPRVWCIHSEGHYLCGVSCWRESEGDEPAQRFLMTFNSIVHNNTNQPIMKTLLETLSSV